MVLRQTRSTDGRPVSDSDSGSVPDFDSDRARLHRKVTHLTTLVLFLVFVELARVLGSFYRFWNPLAVGLGVFLTAFAWFLAHLTS